MTEPIRIAVPLKELEGLESFLGRFEEPRVRYQPDQIAMQRELIAELRSVIQTAQLTLNGWMNEKA